MSTTSVQYYSGYNPNSWMDMRNNRYDYGTHSRTSFNQQYFDDYFNRASLTDLVSNRRVGILSGPKVDNFDFGRYLQLLPSWATKHNLVGISQGMKGQSLYNLGSIRTADGRLNNFGPSMEIIPANNKDGKRIFSQILELDHNQQQRWRFTVSQEMLDATSAANGGAPTGNTQISPDTEIWVLPKDISFLGEMKDGCINCKPNSCGRGYRQLFIKKNQHYNGNYPQGTYTGDFVSEVVIVLDTEVLPDGSLRLVVKRGANGKTVNTAGGLQFQDGSITLEQGDFVLVGTITPTTECIDLDLKCATLQPKSFSFCHGMKQFLDCVVCVNKTVMSYAFSDELLNPQEKIILTATRNMQTYAHRMYNEFIFGDTIYAQNYPMPQHPTVPSVGGQVNGELIPEGIEGLVLQHDRLSREIEVNFTSCDISCNEYVLAQFMDILEAGRKDSLMPDKGAPYSSPGWLLWGDLKVLKGIMPSRMFDYAPTTMADRMQQINGFSANFGANATSIFRQANSPALANAKNEYDRAANDMGVELTDIQLGRYTFKGIHDRMMAYLEPGVVRLIHVPDITFFTDNQDEMMEGLFGGQSPFLPATAVKGRLTPSIVSQDMAPVMLNGQIRTMARNDCPIQLFAYMRAGLYLSPENIGANLKLRFTASKPNPAYTGDDINIPQTIKVPLWELGCACELQSVETEYELDSWNGSTPVVDLDRAFFRS